MNKPIYHWHYFLKATLIKIHSVPNCIVEGIQLLKSKNLFHPKTPLPPNFQTFRLVWIGQPIEMIGDLSKAAIGVTLISLNLVPNQTVLIHNGVGLGFSMATTFTSSLVLSSLSAFGVAT